MILSIKARFLEDETPEEFFTNPKHERAKQFLQQVIDTLNSGRLKFQTA